MSYTQEDIQRQWDDMVKEDYPWAEEDMPNVDMTGIKAINHNTHHVVGCACFLCVTDSIDHNVKDDDLPF